MSLARFTVRGKVERKMVVPQNHADDVVVRLSAPPERATVARHSGPGLRLIVWVQGCSLLCTRRCLNPHLLNPDGGYSVQSWRAARALLDLAGDFDEVEGVTVLGGEPFDQAAALASALAPVADAGLSVMVYTGHRLEDLRAGNEDGVDRLLALTDILVDGPFVEELYDESLIWRGSSNQRVLLMSTRYADEEVERALSTQRRAAAVSVGARGDVTVSGAQNLDTARRLRQLTKLTKSFSHTSPTRGRTQR